MNKMVKTSRSKCLECHYRCTEIGKSGLIVCDYFVKTGNRRNCPIGYCDKFKPLDPEERKQTKRQMCSIFKRQMQYKKEEQIPGSYFHDSWDVDRNKYKGK